MKFKTTTKKIKENYANNYIISVSYCDLQTLLKYESPRAYTSGIYGWNYDLYDIDGIAICMGYRGMPSGKNFDYSLVRKYETKAQKIANRRKKENQAWGNFVIKQRKDMDKLLKAFIKEVYKVV